MLLLQKKDRRILEICLVLVIIGLSALLYSLQGSKMVVLNLFYLPVVLASFFLGRYRAGIFALLCVLGASAIAVTDIQSLGGTTSPLVIVLSISVWAAVLGMTALLVGTLSDERTAKTQELHEAYVGVVEVLSQYLQSANPGLKARSIRVAELSQRVARHMKLTPQQIDDIRVAALLQDVSEVEITARVIRRAVGTLEVDVPDQHTFQGKDLVFSLGSVLSSAMPLMQSHTPPPAGSGDGSSAVKAPLGAQVLKLVRQFDAMTVGEHGEGLDPQQALEELRYDREATYSPAVLAALERVVTDLSDTGPELLQLAR